MRFFKTNNPPRSAEDQAAYARLSAVADRTKALNVSPYEAMMASPPPAPEPEPEPYQAPTIEPQSFDEQPEAEPKPDSFEPLELEAPEAPETFGEPEASATFDPSETPDEPEASDEPEFPQ